MPERDKEDLAKGAMILGGIWLLSGMLKPAPKPVGETVKYYVETISSELKLKMEQPDKYATESNFSKNKTVYDAWKPEFDKYGVALPARDWDKMTLFDKNIQIKVDLLGAFNSYWDKAGLEPKGGLQTFIDSLFWIGATIGFLYLGAAALNFFTEYMKRRPPKKEPTAPETPLPAPPAPTTPAPTPKTVFIYSKYKLYDDKTYSTNAERYAITTATLDSFYYVDKKLWGAAFALYWGHPYEYYYPAAAPQVPEVTPPVVNPESPPSITDGIAAWLALKLGTTKEWILTHPLEVAIALAAVGVLWLIALAEPTPIGEAVMSVVTIPLIGILTPLGMPKAPVPEGKPKGYVAGYSIAPLSAEAGKSISLTITVQNIGDGTGDIRAIIRREDLKTNVHDQMFSYSPNEKVTMNASFTMPANDVNLSFEAQTLTDTTWKVDSKRTDMVKYVPTVLWKEATFSLDMLLHGWYEKKEFLDEYCVGLRGRSYDPDSVDLSFYKGCVFTGMSKGGVYLYSGCQSLWSGTLKAGQEIYADSNKARLKYNGGGSVTIYKKEV